MGKAIATLGLLLVPRVVFACPVCFGQSDSPMASATNTGIIVMLGFVVAVLSGFAAFIVRLNLRARQIGDAADAGPAGSSSRLASSTPREGAAQC